MVDMKPRKKEVRWWWFKFDLRSRSVMFDEIISVLIATVLAVGMGLGLLWVGCKSMGIPYVF